MDKFVFGGTLVNEEILYNIMFGKVGDQRSRGPRTPYWICLFFFTALNSFDFRCRVARCRCSARIRILRRWGKYVFPLFTTRVLAFVPLSISLFLWRLEMSRLPHFNRCRLHRSKCRRVVFFLQRAIWNHPLRIFGEDHTIFLASQTRFRQQNELTHRTPFWISCDQARLIDFRTSRETDFRFFKNNLHIPRAKLGVSFSVPHSSLARTQWGCGFLSRGPFLESPENLSGPKSHLWNWLLLVLESRPFNLFSR